MAKNAKIKKECADVQVGFKGSGLPLRLRTPEDINELAKMATETKDAYLLSMFEYIPTEAELREAVGEEFLKENDKDNAGKK